MLEEAHRRNEDIDRQLEEKYNKKKQKSTNNSRQMTKKNLEDLEYKSQMNTTPKVRKNKMNSNKMKGKKSDNKEFAFIMYSFVFLFLCMMSYLVYFQISLSDDIINSTYNPRQDLLSSTVVRGKIMDSQGNVLAQTETNSEGIEFRSYPMNDLYSHVVGYDVMGKSGIELANNFSLLTSNAFFGEKIINELNGSKNQGDNIITTLNTSIQKAAYDALGQYNGAVVVMEPSTGKILSMVSKTSFDPSFKERSWESITSSSESILLNRATNGLYIPGSIFKLVTLLDYIRTDSSYRSFTYNCTGSVVHGDTTIQCAGAKVHGNQTLEEALANSCNGAFIEIGTQLNIESYQNSATDLLFNSTLPGVFTAKNSAFSLDSESDLAKIMMTSMGQGDTLVTPLHMALLVSTIANDGMLMEPYVVEEIVNNTGSQVKKYSPKSYGQLLTIHEATQLKEYMTAVVEYGTASDLNSMSVSVAGKTGTAEYSSDKGENHSWFIGFTNPNNSDLAISVLVEESNGGLKASTVAKKIIEAYY